MKTTLIISTLFTVALTAPTTHRRQNNAQTFTGNLGGKAATPILNSGDAKRPFSVGGATFVNLGAAVQRSCDQQFNACANSANGGNATVSVDACAQQKTQCEAVGANANAGNAGTANANANANGNANGNANNANANANGAAATGNANANANGNAAKGNANAN